MTPKTSASPLTVAMLAVICGVGFFLRTACYNNFVTPDGGFLFYGYDPDPFDHLRRITLGVKSFPAIPVFDSYAAFPFGLGQIWSPLFDYFLSCLALLCGGSDQAIQTVGFLANPILSVLTIIALFFVARKLFASAVAGYVAALLLALSPGHSYFTLGPTLDHHVLEPLLVLLLLSCTFLGAAGRLSASARCLVPLCFPLTILVWRGVTLFWAILFIATAVRGYVENGRGNRGYLLDWAQIFTAGAAILAILCLVNPWQETSGLSFNLLSWFHVIVLLMGAGFVVVLGSCNSPAAAARRMGVLALCGIAACALPQVRIFAREIISGLSFIGGNTDSWLTTIKEQQHMFHEGFIAALAKAVTPFWLLVPLSLAVAFRQWQKEKRGNPHLLAFAVWGVCMLPLVRIRYVVVIAVLVALAVGHLFGRAWDRWEKRRARMALAVGMAALLAGGYPEFKAIANFANPPLLAQGEFGAHGILSWIRSNTPPTSHYYLPTQTPEYGILAEWGLGSKIYYLAQRPAVATAFGWEAHGIYDVGGFFVTDTPEIAYGIALRNKAKYVIVSRLGYESYLHIARQGVARGVLAAGTLPRYDEASSLYKRLLFYDGSAISVKERLFPALSNYRLVHEVAPSFASAVGNISYYKLFEVVPGAVINGVCPPNSGVTVDGLFKTANARSLRFSDRAQADSQGDFSFRVPYANDQRQGSTEPLGRYVITCGERVTRSVTVPEEAVRNGLVLELGTLAAQ